MSDPLSPLARALLAATREELTPDPTVIARVRGNVDAAIGTGATAGLALATKLGLLALVAAVGLGALILPSREVGDALAIGELPSSTPRLAAATSHEPPPQSIASAELASGGASRRAREGLVARAASRDRSPAAARVSLAREVELVDRAIAALRARDANTALSTVRLHTLETAAAGQLAEDISAIEIEALCMQRAPEAAARLTAFDTRWPSSAQREHLTRACR